MTSLARNSSGGPGCGSPNKNNFGIRNPTKMHFQPSSVPNGPRSYQNNGGARNNRGNYNHNGNANSNNQWSPRNANANGNGPSPVPNGPRAYQNNGGSWNNRGNNNYNGNANNQWSSRNGNPRNGNPNGTHDYNNQRDTSRDGFGNENNQRSSNYKGKNFNPNYKGKNYNPSFSRPAQANVGQARNGNRRRLAYRNQNENYNLDIHPSNIDVQMDDAPSDEPNDIEMPDAPALPDPVLPDPVSYLWEAAHGLQHALTSLQRIKALALGAVAIKEMAESMLRLASELDPSFVPN
ncbi:uncharacterized protein N7518_002352 [Penicillium psychrosexuale]|uniref:uncharacterized protein n=1 Tax=Penicillium psychrosexuale TaxID=1002107 RepID=UPI002544DCCE|nr:uncharacterized protein N7518_002352 [Penicillium psychrosexuale]KAJ5800284.1 hypothetical protein N7518_002352 [Penicillium psychrosexuale]